MGCGASSKKEDPCTSEVKVVKEPAAASPPDVANGVIDDSSKPAGAAQVNGDQKQAEAAAAAPEAAPAAAPEAAPAAAPAAAEAPAVAEPVPADAPAAAAKPAEGAAPAEAAPVEAAPQSAPTSPAAEAEPGAAPAERNMDGALPKKVALKGRMSFKKTGSNPTSPAGPPFPEGKVHSAIRWGKSKEEIEKVAADNTLEMAKVAVAPDPRNGNCAIHLACQNGHTALAQWLLDLGADLGAQNKKGMTALHMSVEYDFYFQTKVLLEAGADREKTNVEGHPAILGIDGKKSGGDAWDAPVNIFKAAGDDAEQFEVAYAALEAAAQGSVAAADLEECALKKREDCKTHWNEERFAAIVSRFKAESGAE